jgi:serine/threonine protein kinase
MDEDLNSYINNTTKRKEIPTLFQRLKIASQIASGLSWVASKGVVHGDLKASALFFFFFLFFFSCLSVCSRPTYCARAASSK